jgi:hypothetical protein
MCDFSKFLVNLFSLYALHENVMYILPAIIVDKS